MTAILKIRITGLRPGEKLYEELLVNNQSTKTVHPRINFEIQKNINNETLNGLLDQLANCLKDYDEENILKILKKFNIGFDHNQKSLSKKY